VDNGQRRRAALRTFTAKWSLVERIIRFHARRLGIRAGQDTEDLLQSAALQLWETCLAGMSERQIHCEVISLGAFRRWKATNRVIGGRGLGRKDAGELESLPEPGDRTNPIRLGRNGVSYCVADLAIDSPEAFELLASGISTAELARRLRVSWNAINQRAGQLGGVKVGARWLFPADAGGGPEGGMRQGFEGK
jgi:hypothetical protein